MENFLNKFFNDPKTGLQSSGQKIWNKIKNNKKAKKLGITRKDIDEFLKNNSTVQVLKRQKRIPRKIVADYTGQIYQIDLLDMSKLSHHNKGYNWVLCCVDVASRRAWVEPVKRKSAELVTEALRKILYNKVSVPNSISSDNGKEFVNKRVKKLFEELNIAHHLNEVGDKNHMAIVEVRKRRIGSAFWTTLFKIIIRVGIQV